MRRVKAATSPRLEENKRKGTSHSASSRCFASSKRIQPGRRNCARALHPLLYVDSQRIGEPLPEGCGLAISEMILNLMWLVPVRLPLGGSKLRCSIIRADKQVSRPRCNVTKSASPLPNPLAAPPRDAPGPAPTDGTNGLPPKEDIFLKPAQEGPLPSLW